MRFTMKRTLALVLALMLAMPTFVLANGVAVAQDANGQITANEPVLNDSPVPDDSLLPDDDLLLDGNLVLDGLSLELPQPEDPSGDLELGPQDPAEGGAGEQPDAQEVGAPGEPPLELGDDAQGIGDEIPVAQPLMPPDDVLEATMEVENVTDPAMAANDGEKTPWQQLAEDFQSKNAITLTADCIASESDTRLISATSGTFALNLGNNTINRNLNASKEEGNVIKTQVDMTVNGPGKITGGKTKGNNGGIYGGGGIAVDGASTLSLAGGAEITGNLADSAGSHGCGGGVYLRESDSATDKNRLIMNNSAILSNTAAGFGGGVYLEDYAELEMNNGAIISDNNAQEGGGVVVDKYASFNMKGGSITGNHANGTGYGYGGGISLRPDSTFTMENGQITGNHADFKGGGGVYISDKSTFTMTGGTIEDNFADSADCNGGGVYVGGTFSIGGGSKISITGNTKNGNANNVYLPANKTITVNGTLSDDSIIGVTTANVPSSSNGYIPITNRFSKAYLSKNSVFISDNANYEVGVINNTDTDKQLGLGLKIVHKAESVSVDYDGNDHSPKVNVTVPEGSDQTVVTYKGELPEKVGKYTVEYEVSNSATVTSKYCFPAKGKGTVTIRPVVRIEGWTYGEQPKTPTVESASLPQGATLAYEYFTDADCTKKTTSADGASSEGGAPRNAGTYYVRATATVNSNEIKSLAKSFTIKSASMKGSAEGYKGEYDGKAHGITVNVTEPKTGYTVKYGAKEGTYDKKSLTYTDAGVYTVYYQVTAENYETVTGSAAVEITAKASDNLNITLSQTEYTYDGTAKKPTVTVTDKDTKQIVPASEYSVTYSDNVNAGTAKVTLTDAEGGNYAVKGIKTFTIKGAAMTIEAKGYNGEYDGKAHGITVNVTDPQKGRTVKYGEKEGTYNRDSLTYTDAGVYTVYYQVTAKNYVTVTGSETVEITAKASDNLSITLSQAEYTYDGAAKKPTVTVKDKKTGQVVPEKEYKVTYANNVNAGTATVTLTDVAGGNYVVNGDKTFTINKAAMVVEAEGYKGEYDGKAHGITVNVTEPKTGYTVKYGAKEGTYDKKSLTYTDAGVYTVYYQVTAENYETVTGSATVEITTNKKTSMTVVAEDYKGEYDREAHGIKVTVTEPKTGYTVKYSTVDGTYDKDSLTYTDTGVYTVYYQVTAENYETVTGSAKVEITARIPTDLTIDLSAKTYYYYAKARKPTVTVKDGDTVVPENEYRVTYKNNIHAGTATVKITSFTKGNYSFAEERNFTIKPRNVHLKYTKLTFTYDGKYHLPLAKAIGVYPADENKYNVIMTGSGRNVGRYIARTTGIDNPDYHMLDVGEETRVIFYINPRGGRGSGSSGSGNARFVAEKKIGTEGIGTVTYDGKAQEPKFVVKCVFNDSNGVASNTVLTVPASEYKVTYSNNVDVGKATVKVTDVPGGNFIVDFSPEFTIAPRKATVTAKDQHVKTVDSVKTGVMAVKVKGLAKGHTLKSVKLDVDIKAGAKKGRIIPGRAKIVDAEGKDVTRNYKLDYAAGSLAVTAPKPDFTLLARMTVSGNSKMALKVAWTDVADACAYDVYFAKCGSEFRLKKTVKASKPRVVRFKGLDKRVSYKAYVKAWKMVNNQKVYIGNASPQVHAITGGYTSQECNTQSVKLNRTRLTLKAGGSASLKAKLKCVKSGKKLLDHADKVRWYSTDANVATVDANGKVTAVGKGSCTIYAIANNGVRSSAKVKVK